MGKPRIGIYGGSFNPPHTGHVRAAELAAGALRLDRLLVVPAGTPPHKTLPPGTPENRHRLEMTRLAFAGATGAQVCAIELERSGLSYTADTVRAFAEDFPGADLWLIVGTDMFLTLHDWARPEEIFAACRIAVFARENGSQKAILAQAERLQAGYGARTDVIPGLPVEISSSALRDMLASGKGQEYLPPKVFEYITKHALYGKESMHAGI